MDAELRTRRDQAAARHDAALERDAARATAWFTAELQGVVTELEAVSSAADRRGADAVEVAKAYRWLGDALFDLSRGHDRALLARGERAYERAEALLEPEVSPVEQAKTAFNYANTLRGLSDGSDVPLLEAAETRYENALAVFRTNRLPQLASAVEGHLPALRTQLRLAREAARVGQGLKQLASLGKRAAAAGPLERERIGPELATIVDESNPRRLSQAVAEAVAAAETLAKQHADRMPQAQQQLAALGEQVAQLHKLLAPDDAGEQPGGSMESAMLALLEARLEQEIARGRAKPERAAQLRDVVARARAAFASGGDDLVTLQKRTQALREVMRIAADFAAQPSWQTKEPASGTRAGRAVTILAGLRTRMLAEKLVGMLPSAESAAASDLLTRVVTLEARVRQLAEDEARVAAVDGDVWRLAGDVQAYLCRYNLQLAQPVFQTRREHGDPRSVFVSGGDALRNAADRLQAGGEIMTHGDERPGNYAQQRWTQLCSATVAVFDVGVPAGVPRAQVCYELGLALALGKPCVITLSDGQALPFDVDPTPHILRERAEADSAMLLYAIGNALAIPAWGGAEGGLGDRPARALRWLDQRTGGRLAEGAESVALRLAEAERGDAIGFRRALDQLLGMLGADAPLALLPAWPAAYPDPARKPCCFHVMPFQPAWANRTRELARSACAAAGWSYRRGDESEEQRIIRAIWTEIASASAVLVDVTGCNPNVALELGLAHALGRPTWLVAQGDSDPYRFPSIQKVQVHRYEAGDGFPGFEASVRGLLASAGV